MAISRGAGTEIIRSVLLEDVADAHGVLIYGEQHHIYTVLSISVFAVVLASAGNEAMSYIYGYDAKGSDTTSVVNLFKQPMQVNQTFVWNDKFSFNGHEPTDFAAGAGVDSIAKQNAIADQGSSVHQELRIVGTGGADRFDVICTYIDQNNA